MKSEKRKTKYSIIFILAVVIAVSGCSKKAPAKDGAAAGKQKDEVQHRVLSFNLEGLSDKGTKKWDVTGKSAESVSETKIKLDDIIANSYGEGGAATITADKGVYDKAKNNVVLEQNVRATIENAQSFGNEAFSISGTNKDPADPSRAKSDKPKKTKTVITCDSEAIFDYEKNIASFNKNVKVVSDDGKVDADKISVIMDPSSKKVIEIVAEGNVKMVRGENTTFSDKATYVEADKKVVLSGQPKLVVYQEGGIAGVVSPETAKPVTKADKK